MDSGATVHLCGDISVFTNVKDCKVGIKCANNNVMYAYKKGDVVVIVEGITIVLKDVLYVEGAPMLISIGKLVEEEKYMVSFCGNWCLIQSHPIGTEIFRIVRVPDDPTRKLYILPFLFKDKKKSEQSLVNYEILDNGQDSLKPGTPPKPSFGILDMKLLHLRYNHISAPYLLHKFPKVKGELDKLCDACVVGGLPCRKFAKKMKQSHIILKELESKVLENSNLCQEPLNTPLPDSSKPVTRNSKNSLLQKFSKPISKIKNFLKSKSKSYNHQERKDFPVEFKYQIPENPDALESTNYLINNASNAEYGKYLAGDTKVSPIVSVRGYKYGYLLICKGTRVKIPLLGKNKNDFEVQAKSWIMNYYNQYGKYPAGIHFDKGTELTNKAFLKWLNEVGTIVTFSCTGKSNQNSIAERPIGVSWSQMLKLLANSGIPFQFWCFAWVYAVLVSNLIPHQALKFLTPLEVAGILPYDFWVYVLIWM